VHEEKEERMEQRYGYRVLLAIILSALFFGHSVASAQEVKPCKTWVAQVVSVEGNVQAKRMNGTEWVPVKLNDTFCPGDMIRVAEHSRAGVILPNEVLLRFDQNTTLTFNGIEKQGTSLIDLLRGAVHFFSRLPHGLSVTTPFINGTVEGTEFLVRVTQEQTVITVFEGVVAAANQHGSITVSPGQAAIAQSGQAPSLQVVVHPRDAVQWALYYPPIIDYRLEDFPQGAGTSWEGLMRKSIERYGEGDLTSALSILCQAPEGIGDPRFFNYRAGLLLTVGRVDEASADIEKALSLDPKNSQAFALKSVVAVVQNDKDKALELANKAIELDQHSATARVARSYALQARFDLKGALADIQQAVKLAPKNALAYARLSELWLSHGYLDKALDAAQQAVALNPRLSRTQVVLGFAYLDEIKIKEAKEAFNQAIELDQGNPMARLGLGLAKIREGNLEEGRQEIEIAAILDPNNSLIRSYLGKAYFDEKRDKLSGNQLDAAKNLDPKDPTPWFYDGIRKLTINRPVEALQDVQKSIELNDNRAVYRSSLLMDEDLAARSAALGRVYSELGFQDLALVEGWKSVNTDPADYSGHRFLADSYSALPRHEIARVSELLQSQLLQPLNVTPVPAYLAESNPMILEGAGPATLSFNEFNPLFLRNRLALQVDGVGGQKRTFGDDVVQAGVWDNVSYSLSQYRYQTDGFRQNNDQQHDIYDAFAQVSVTPKLSVQAEYRYNDLYSGDLRIFFHPDVFYPDKRDNSFNDYLRSGIHYAVSPHSDIIASYIYATSNEVLTVPTFGVKLGGRQYSYTAEAQYLFRSDYFNVTTGGGHLNVKDKQNWIMFWTPFLNQKTNTEYSNVYCYLQLKLLKELVLTVGADEDFYEGIEATRTQFNPKAGFIWNPFPGTTVRAAYFKVMKRVFIGNQTIEPTQVAGFNQFFDDDNVAKSWCKGVGIDQKLSSSVFAGAEFFKRNVRSPFFTQIPPLEVPSDERLTRFYLYWTPSRFLSIKLEYQYEEFNLDPEANNEYWASRIHTHRVPLEIGFFHPSGLILKCGPTYVRQHGAFLDSLTTTVPTRGSSSFWVMDASIGYRLPQQIGRASCRERVY
jgi:tetratricopeptide (TPR) repeat protein